jgi:uncharacterized membrane protein YqiK
MDPVALLVSYWWLVAIVALLAGYKFVLRIFGVVIIPEDSIGVVNKKFVIFGKNRTLPDGTIIALNGEAGLQADALAPGLHFWLWPWQFIVSRQRFVTVQEGSVGVVEARDGRPLSGGRVLAKQVECGSFQSARDFLINGGERGPQIAIIPPGTYRINSSLFSVAMEKVLEIADNMVGIVTTKEGQPLRTGDIAGKEIPGHTMFQNGQAFLDNGGFKGLQEQVLLAGRYFINPRFATVEPQAMTSVPIAHAGVVIAYVGETGVDVTGETFKHGNLVSKGQKGVWIEPLDPGKYPINPYTHKVENVPTANIVLNWADTKTEAHKLDANLSTITVRSSDGFTFNLDVSQIIHIPRTDAPKVIARFGSVANLVTQVLEPTIGNYFRNAAQGRDAIDFLKEREQRQRDARDTISAALHEYNVGAVDTLIGDITPPPDLMKTLTDRKIAQQQKVTFDVQRDAQEARKALAQAQAIADTQPSVVTAERSVEIAQFAANATIKKAEGEAKSKTVVAEADAMVTRTVGGAVAERTLKVGTAEADVIKLKIASMESSNYALIETAKALAGSGFKLVPDIVAGGGGGSEGSSSLVNVLIARLIHDGLRNAGKPEPPATTVTPAVDIPPPAPPASEPPARK